MKRILTLLILSIAALPVWARSPKAYPRQKGDIYFNYSIPYINGFHFQLPAGPMSDGGFLGISGGADYCYKTNRFISLQAGAAINNELPFPAAIEEFHDSPRYQRFEIMSAAFVNLRNNHIWRRFDFGYGLMLSRHTWVLQDRYYPFSISKDSVVTQRYVNTALGGSFAVYYRWSRRFYTGLLYQPQLLSVQNGVQWKYEHFISFDLLFRLKVANVAKHARPKNLSTPLPSLRGGTTKQPREMRAIE